MERIGRRRAGGGAAERERRWRVDAEAYAVGDDQRNRSGGETRLRWRVAGAEGQVSGRHGERRSQERRGQGLEAHYSKLRMLGRGHSEAH
eukprot:3241223-Pleurochrysis_carterae.AAC.1